MNRDWLNWLYHRFGITQRHAQLVLLVFLVSLIARGGVLARGLSIDDYAVSFDSSDVVYPALISQGRFLHAGIFGAIGAMGVNVSDVYIAFGLLALFLQAGFIVSILRFVGVDEIHSAGLVGALIAVHPYGTEIFTFRMALPGYCAAMLFSVLALEAIIRYPRQWAARSGAFFASLAMLFTYQVFVNYVAVAILGAWVFGEVSSRDLRSIYRERAGVLAAVGLSSMVAFLSVMRMLSLFGVVNTEDRTHLIALDMVPQRLVEIAGSLKMMYWRSEPIMPAWVKVLAWLLIGFSVVSVIRCHWSVDQTENRSGRAVLLALSMVLLVPLSLGLIILFRVGGLSLVP